MKYSKFVLFAVFLLCGGLSRTQAQTVATVFSFANLSNTSCPASTPRVEDPGGILVGTPSAYDYGVTGSIFRLVPPASTKAAWTSCLIYSFDYSGDGTQPLFVTPGPDGSYFGGTALGGGGVYRDAARLAGGLVSHDSSPGAGTIFKVSPPAAGQTRWAYATLHDFQYGSADGQRPISGMMARSGTVFGSTVSGGSKGFGIVFKLTPTRTKAAPWPETVLHSFGGGEGEEPILAWIGPDGSLYGTTRPYGAKGSRGIAWRLLPPGVGQTAWRLQVLHGFTEHPGDVPSRLIQGPGGVFYGTYGSSGPEGTDLFRLAPPSPGNTAWDYSVVYRFAAGQTVSLSFVAGDGTFYGATDQYCRSAGTNVDCGQIFKLTPPHGQVAGWRNSVLYSVINEGAQSWDARVGFVRDSSGLALLGLTATSSEFFTSLVSITEAGWN